MPEQKEVYELFFSSTAARQSEDGLIWKPMLPVGTWTVGPNGGPLRVVEGNSPDPRQAIGLKDIVDAFREKAVAHITIPKTHADAVDENTGYIEAVDIANYNGVPTLFGGHRFTDPEIKRKVEQGSIANTSVGLEFDYVRKEDGKKFPIVLRHNALTNRPWLGSRLAPFGVKAGEEDVEYVVHAAEFDGFDLSRDQINELLSKEFETIIAFGEDRVLYEKDGKSFVRNFQIVNGDLVLDEEEYIVTSKATDEDDDADKATSDSSPTLSEEDPSKETSNMSDKNKTDETVSPKEIDLSEIDVTKLDLSDHPAIKAAVDENERLKTQLAEVAKRERVRDADKLITDLKAMGMSEERGFTAFLKCVRDVLLSDEGDTAILLSEDDGEPAPITASQIVRNLLDTLPKGEDGKLTAQFAEQHTDPLNRSEDEKPSNEDVDEPLPIEERVQAAEDWFDKNFPATAV